MPYLNRLGHDGRKHGPLKMEETGQVPNAIGEELARVSAGGVGLRPGRKEANGSRTGILTMTAIRNPSRDANWRARQRSSRGSGSVAKRDNFLGYPACFPLPARPSPPAGFEPRIRVRQRGAKTQRQAETGKLKDASPTTQSPRHKGKMKLENGNWLCWSKLLVSSFEFLIFLVSLCPCGEKLRDFAPWW